MSVRLTVPRRPPQHHNNKMLQKPFDCLLSVTILFLFSFSLKRREIRFVDSPSSSSSSKVVSWMRAHTHTHIVRGREKRRRKRRKSDGFFSYSHERRESPWQNLGLKPACESILGCFKTTHTRVDSCCEKEKCVFSSTRATKERNQPTGHSTQLSSRTSCRWMGYNLSTRKT